MDLQPNDIRYPADDPRFEFITTDMTLDQCVDWCTDFPPAPVMASGELYPDFVKRQTTYSAYRNDVIKQRDSLKRKAQQLAIPPVPVGDDISAAITWIQSTGKTPLEFMTQVYRDTGQQMGHRIAAASKLMEYIHRKMPQQIETTQMQQISAKNFDPSAIRALSEKELAALEKLLEKMK